MRCRSAFLLTVVLLVLPVLSKGSATHGGEANGVVAIGSSTSIWSKTLHERRRVLVYLPNGYAEGHKRYPVLYLLDAENQFRHSIGIVDFLAANRRIPEMIVVGITNTDRDRDLTPPTTVERELQEDPTAGGADRFLKFLVDELAPWTESHYRTAPFRVLVGHSFGGLTAIYALTTRPRDFQAYIAISPALGWNNREYLQRAERALPTLVGPHFLYVTCADQEKRIAQTSQELASWIEGHPVEDLTFAFHQYVGESHGTTPHLSLYDGLEKLYAGWHEQ